MYILYVSSLIKSVISLHSLINNKIHNKEQEQDNLKKEKEAEEDKKKLEEAKKEKENRE
jgi:26S proteasome regulatory subunit N8